MHRSLIDACGLVVLLGCPCWAQVTQRVSIGSAGAQGQAQSTTCSLSADGRFVAFESMASNLVSGDTNGARDVFVRDRQTGTTECVSVASSGAQANGFSISPSISADGRYVAFHSAATNLVPNDTNGQADVFVRDRVSSTTERVSVNIFGAQAIGGSARPSISSDGRYVAFSSTASNLIVGDTNGFEDIFVRDRQNATTERVSVDSAGAQSSDNSYDPSISADGRCVAFYSYANDLVSGDTFPFEDVFVHDCQSGTTEMVSVDPTGAQAIAPSYNSALSADGRFVAFDSLASNLVAGDTNSTFDVFLRDRQSGTTERVSLDSAGGQGNQLSTSPSISPDGRYVAFYGSASNLVAGDTNGSADVFVRDRQSGTTERVSVDSDDGQGSGPSVSPSVSADGRYVAFESFAANLVPEDTNAAWDVFVRDRLGGTNFASLCDPGVGSVISCPCSNPSSGLGQGCDNSSATGGAMLSASGGTYLSSDSLVFTTSGEPPTALSIVLQGSALISSGTVFGQGVRCVGGVLKRLYTKAASGGSITAPNFGAGDPTVSAHSAALGDSIPAGQSRWYIVCYRDPVVLGGCPVSSKFNATQTGEVAWSP